MIEVSIEQAYDEACRALGESVVRERLLTRALHEQQERARTAPDETPAPTVP